MGAHSTSQLFNLDSITENLNTAIFRTTMDESGRFIDVNPAFLRMFGYSSRDELQHASVAELYAHVHERNELRRELMEQGSLLKREVQLRRKSGEIFDALITSVMVKNDAGEGLYIDGVVDDITLYKFVSGVVFNIFQILQIPRIREAIQINDCPFRMFVEYMMNKVTPDETGASGNK